MPHAWSNSLQSALLILTLLGLSAMSGGLLLGESGVWLALLAALLALFLEPATTSRLTLRLYRARPIPPETAPDLWRMLVRLADAAALPALPRLYYVPSAVANAFTVGGRRDPAIALSEGLLRGLSGRELAGVLAHEVAHIAHGDIRVMGLADYISRLTSLLALVGQGLILLVLPLWWHGEVDIHWPGLLLLALAPHVAWLAQLGLSRSREYAADQRAAELTGDPEGLAAALARIEGVGRAWQRILLPGWGNPEPSWLRTHPATEQRIRRLLALRPAPRSSPWPMPVWPADGRIDRPPRWRLGGYWR